MTMMIKMLMMKMDKKMGISVCVCVYSILSPVCSPLTGALGAAKPSDDDDGDGGDDGDDVIRSVLSINRCLAWGQLEAMEKPLI